MHEVCFAQPGIQTARYVNRYAQRRTQLGKAYISQPVHARLELVLAFQFGDPCYIQQPSGIGRAPKCVIAGSQTRGSKSLMLSGNMDSFYIFLRPAALQLLFGIPMAELSDKSYDAHAPLGNSILELQAGLGEASSFSQRIQVSERFIVGRNLNPIVDRTERIVQQVLDREGDVSIEDLASDASLGTRQFSRVFKSKCRHVSKGICQDCTLSSGGGVQDEIARSNLGESLPGVPLSRSDAPRA